MPGADLASAAWGVLGAVPGSGRSSYQTSACPVCQCRGGFKYILLYKAATSLALLAREVWWERDMRSVTHRHGYTGDSAVKEITEHFWKACHTLDRWIRETLPEEVKLS